MFELYKKRQLGDYIVDSFTFFKTFGKHFFKIFFIINATMLLVTGALMYWFLKLNFQFLSNDAVQKANPNQFLDYLGSSPAILAFTIVSIIILVLISLFNSAYPILYLKLIAQQNNNDFTAKEVLKTFRQSIWKIFKFTIGLLFIVMPALFILIIALFFLCFALVGIPLIIVAIPTLFTFVHLSYYSYLTEEKSFFESLNHAYILVKEDFWSTIGASFIVMIIIQMVQASITMFFYFVGIFAFIFFAIANPDFEKSSFQVSPVIIILLTIVFVLILVLSNIFNNILVINQGIIYYSLGSENKISATEIESIGSNNE
ncbi:hypothetical protein RC62_2888 [Flavobacterium aquidurense]|uniref:Transmembrane protein n=2 Tax=Flavobacterium aquidurense TaxID=362413 RepID=A0A0Q0XPD8_9FLAO|nr:hypothetical protein RC62_2888 [Flavobacterium aquidurense]